MRVRENLVGRLNLGEEPGGVLNVAIVSVRVKLERFSSICLLNPGGESAGPKEHWELEGLTRRLWLVDQHLSAHSSQLWFLLRLALHGRWTGSGP